MHCLINSKLEKNILNLFPKMSLKPIKHNGKVVIDRDALLDNSSPCKPQPAANRLLRCVPGRNSWH